VLSRISLEELAIKARDLTRQQFGRTIALYAPLYISNYCENQCVYCGFQAEAKIRRQKLSPEEIEAECLAIKKKGIQNILLLTGESRSQSPVGYIKEAITIAKNYFPSIALEIYPLTTEEYHELYLAGADGVTLYQETYNSEIYDKLHLAGRKKDFQWRYAAPERMAQAGMRHISLGVLLGLADWQEDVYALFNHLEFLWNKYPGVEYSLSFPRLQKIDTDTFKYSLVADRDMLKIISMARLLFPRVGINLSTRESVAFRDMIIEYGITRMSAGSLTTVGGYVKENERSGQFAVNDHRSLDQVKKMLLDKGYDPVITDWRRIGNA